MRLINAASLLPTAPPRFEEFFESRIPKYAILSHRWGDQEVSYQELSKPKLAFWEDYTFRKEGYIKIQQTAKFALGNGCEWIWCDTCCIDKTSSAELTEAINSMYAWYRDAEICFAYLVDWPNPGLTAFTQSVWFTRCWTLQELIAPLKLVFCNKYWAVMGTKRDLVDDIATRTGIDRRVLLKEESLDRFSIAQRMSWSADRIATKTEDVAYCLLGLFDVNMPMLYGEGEKAFVRLQEEIMRRNADQSIFAWSTADLSKRPFASRPAEFAQAGDVRIMERYKKPFTLTNLGVEIELIINPIGCNTYAASLACTDGDDGYPVSLTLEYDPETTYFTRTGRIQRQHEGFFVREVKMPRKLTILRSIADKYLIPPPLYGFRLGPGCQSLLLVNDWDPKHYWDRGRWEHEHNNETIFRIPDGEAPSIATMMLFLGKVQLLVQLTFDFNFNPCCYISRQQKTSVTESWNPPRPVDGEDEKLFDWIDKTSGWTEERRYQENIKHHPLTGRKGWAAKSLNRNPFRAEVSRTITKPYTNVEISFDLKPDVLDWIFDIHKPDEIPDSEPTGLAIVSAGQELQDQLLRSDYHVTAV